MLFNNYDLVLQINCKQKAKSRKHELVLKHNTAMIQIEETSES